MDAGTVFKVNAPHVISENVDGEVVIINLDSGTYYSTTGVGADVWALIERGHSLGQIVQAARSAFDETASIDRAVGAFVKNLHEEALIVADPSTTPLETAPELPSATAAPEFQEPVLNKYQDMKDMLLLDPIHDVDEAGWPAAKSSD